MAESDTTPLPNPPKPPSDVVEVGWGPAAGRAAPPAGAEAKLTWTKPDPSTPGPAAPDHRTRAEAVPVPVAADPDVPDIPGYRFDRRLGRGGMGDVFRVRDLHLNVDRALKVATLGSRDVAAVRMRFDREVRALAAVEHPNVVPIYHAGEANGHLYFVMRFAPRGSLADHLPAFAANPRACAALAAKVARGVEALHARGRVHRDLKPQNILLGDRDEPMVADCGLVALLDDPCDGPPGAAGPDTGPAATLHTVSGAAVGTRFYMAPEQVEGRSAEYGPGCDIWAVGVTLYELLAGRRPYTDDGPADVRELILTAAPPPLPAGVPAELARVVRRCLEKRPADRYASAADLAADLERWLARERRRRVLTRAAALAAALALALAAFWPRAQANVDPVKPPPTAGERAAAGEVLRLTDTDGNPLVPTSAPRPGRELLATVDRGGTTFSAKVLGFVEFLDGPLPPCRLEGALVVPPHLPEAGTAYVGVYVRRLDWGNGSHSLVWFLMQAVGPDRPGGGRELVARAEVHRWDALGERTSGLGVRPVKAAWPPVPGKGHQARTVPFEIELRPGLVRATVDGVAMPPVSEDAVAGRLRDVGLVPPRPAFGNGLGIVASNQSVSVRNLKLVPIRP
jgi:hypothetical protein